MTLSRSLCPHASGAMPIGARGFSYTFWTTRATISNSFASTMGPTSSTWMTFLEKWLSIFVVFGEFGASLPSMWDQSSDFVSQFMPINVGSIW